MMRSTRRAAFDFRALTIGPTDIAGHEVRLRPIAMTDADRWRALRLRDRALMEPFWIASQDDWEAQHTENAWVREVLSSRHEARVRRSLPMAIEVDGQFSGQANLTAIDVDTGEAELGIWLEAEVAGQSISTLAGGMLVDFAFDQLGLARIIAPVAGSNRRARAGIRAAGFSREAILPAFVSIGTGERVDHELWVLDRRDLPDGGICALARRRADPDAETISIADLVHVGSAHGRQYLPHNVSGVRSMLRYHLGAVRRIHRRLARVHLPERATHITDTGTGVALHRVPAISALRPRRRIRAARSTGVVRPTRAGTWFAVSGPTVAFHIICDESCVGRAELVGLNDHHRIAEVSVEVDRDLLDADVTGAVIRLLVDVGLNQLDLDRISTATEIGDEFACAAADAAGMSREGTVGRIDVWSASGPRST